MTASQSQAFWELCRQGLPLAAEEAAQAWNRGRTFRLDPGVRISRYVESLIDQCNWEAERTAAAA
jgi:hypothetical protein